MCRIIQRFLIKAMVVECPAQAAVGVSFYHMRSYSENHGDNDGLVSPESAAWAYYKGLVTGSVKGVSHWNAIDWHWGDICGKRRERMPKKLPGVACFYSRLVKELKAAGF